MSLTINIEHTKSDAKDLCQTCVHSTIATDGGSQEFRYCHQFEKPIPFRVSTCSGYLGKGEKSIYDLEKIAWVLETKGGKAIGFISPTEAEKRGIKIHGMPE